MGARCNFIFKQSDGKAVALYSHWGESTMNYDLAAALNHALVRKGDESYFVRMVISHLIQNNILDETGFGIFAIDPENLDFLDTPIIIDLSNYSVGIGSELHSIESFITYHLKDEYVEV